MIHGPSGSRGTWWASVVVAIRIVWIDIIVKNLTTRIIDCIANDLGVSVAIGRFYGFWDYPTDNTWIFFIIHIHSSL